jgi:protein tyrosine/serine phosphatase
MQALYADILATCGTAIAEVVTTVARASEGGVLVHCHAGKDRTGVVVALLLSLADVPPPVIIADYALSDTYLQPLYDEILGALDDRARRERARSWLHSRPEAMRDVLAWLDERYGGVEAYLRAAGVSTNDLARVRERLVRA